MKKQRSLDTKAHELRAREGLSVEREAKSDPPETAITSYTPTTREREVIRAYVERSDNTPRFSLTKVSGVEKFAIDHPDPAVGSVMLMQAFGTTDESFFGGIVGQLCNAAGKGTEIRETEVNFMTAMVTGVQPRDQIETMLAAQMAAVHNATMTFARRLNHVENIQQQDSAERAFNKLARTFAAQIEALKRYRSTGEQKVTVEHVTVNEGGQAIVGNVTHAPGGGRSKKADTTP
jgi:hypothetical protein